MEHVLAMAPALVTALIAILTEPAVNLIKRLSSAFDAMPAWTKQLLAVVIAYGLTQLAAVAQVALPDQLSLITEANVQGVLAAIGAWAIHAGKKAAEPAPARAMSRSAY